MVSPLRHNFSCRRIGTGPGRSLEDFEITTGRGEPLHRRAGRAVIERVEYDLGFRVKVEAALAATIEQ